MMLKKFIMFRLHIVFGVVEFSGWIWILTIIETLSQGKENEKNCITRIIVAA